MRMLLVVSAIPPQHFHAPRNTGMNHIRNFLGRAAKRQRLTPPEAPPADHAPPAANVALALITEPPVDPAAPAATPVEPAAPSANVALALAPRDADDSDESSDSSSSSSSVSSDSSSSSSSVSSSVSSMDTDTSDPSVPVQDGASRRAHARSLPDADGAPPRPSVASRLGAPVLLLLLLIRAMKTAAWALDPCDAIKLAGDLGARILRFVPETAPPPYAAGPDGLHEVVLHHLLTVARTTAFVVDPRALLSLAGDILAYVPLTMRLGQRIVLNARYGTFQPGPLAKLAAKKGYGGKRGKRSWMITIHHPTRELASIKALGELIATLPALKFSIGQGEYGDDFGVPHWQCVLFYSQCTTCAVIAKALYNLAIAKAPDLFTHYGQLSFVPTKAVSMNWRKGTAIHYCSKGSAFLAKLIGSCACCAAIKHPNWCEPITSGELPRGQGKRTRFTAVATTARDAKPGHKLATVMELHPEMSMQYLNGAKGWCKRAEDQADLRLRAEENPMCGNSREEPEQRKDAPLLTTWQIVLASIFMYKPAYKARILFWLWSADSGSGKSTFLQWLRYLMITTTELAPGVTEFTDLSRDISIAPGVDWVYNAAKSRCRNMRLLCCDVERHTSSDGFTKPQLAQLEKGSNRGMVTTFKYGALEWKNTADLIVVSNQQCPLGHAGLPDRAFSIELIGQPEGQPMPVDLGEIKSIRCPSELEATPVTRYTDEIEWEPIFAAAKSKSERRVRAVRRSERFALQTALPSRNVSAVPPSPLAPIFLLRSG